MQPNRVPISPRVTSALGVAVQLVLSSWAAAACALALSTANSLWLTLLVSAAAGLLVSATLQRTLWWMNGVLDRLSQGQPTDGIPPRWHGPLAGLVASINGLAGRDREVYDLRRGLLQQTHEAAAQAERNRLARELHDSIKQQIFSIHMSAAAAQARAETDPDGAKAALADVRRSAQEAMVEMNALLQQLAPAPLEKVGLVQALRDQCEALGYRTGATVKVEIGTLPGDDRLPPGTQESLFRIAQEALSNIARHARAEQVGLSLGQDGEDAPLALRIQDNGQGFESEAADGGMGLTNIRQRVTALNGQFSVESRPGAGTTLQIRIPLVMPIDAQEELVDTKLDHTVNKVMLTGLIGGLALAAILIYPLYVLWPARFVDDWTLEGSSVLGLICQIASVALVIFTGYAAGRWSRVGRRGANIMAGAVAGTIAGLLAYYLIGAPAAGTAGSAPILSYGIRVPESEAYGLWMMAESIVNMAWWTYGALWAMLLAGTGLGAIGGILAPTLPAEEQRRSDLTTLSLVAVEGFMIAALVLGVNIAVYGLVESSLAKTASEIAPYHLTFPPMSVTLWSIGTPLLVEFFALTGLYTVCQRAVQAGRSREIVGGPVVTFLFAALSVGIGIVLISGAWPLTHPMSWARLVSALGHFIYAYLWGRLGVSVAAEEDLKLSRLNRRQVFILVGLILALIGMMVGLVTGFFGTDAGRIVAVAAGLLATGAVILRERHIYPQWVRPIVISSILVIAVAALMPSILVVLLLLVGSLGTIAVGRQMMSASEEAASLSRRTLHARWQALVGGLLGGVSMLGLIGLLGVSSALNLVLLIIPTIPFVAGDPGSAVRELPFETLSTLVQSNYVTHAWAVGIFIASALVLGGLTAVGFRLSMALLTRSATPKPPDVQAA